MTSFTKGWADRATRHRAQSEVEFKPKRKSASSVVSVDSPRVSRSRSTSRSHSRQSPEPTLRLKQPRPRARTPGPVSSKMLRSKSVSTYKRKLSTTSSDGPTFVKLKGGGKTKTKTKATSKLKRSRSSKLVVCRTDYDSGEDMGDTRGGVSLQSDAEMERLKKLSDIIANLKYRLEKVESERNELKERNIELERIVKESSSTSESSPSLALRQSQSPLSHSPIVFDDGSEECAGEWKKIAEENTTLKSQLEASVSRCDDLESALSAAKRKIEDLTRTGADFSRLPMEAEPLLSETAGEQNTTTSGTLEVVPMAIGGDSQKDDVSASITPMGIETAEVAESEKVTPKKDETTVDSDMPTTTCG